MAFKQKPALIQEAVKRLPGSKGDKSPVLPGINILKSAQGLGINRCTLSHVLNGRRKANLNTVKALSRLLGKPPSVVARQYGSDYLNSQTALLEAIDRKFSSNKS